MLWAVGCVVLTAGRQATQYSVRESKPMPMLTYNKPAEVKAAAVAMCWTVM